MKKPQLLVSMALCILALTGIVATSYFNGTAEQTITADKAVILSLGSSQTVSKILLSEEDTIYYITAEVNKSAGLTENVNATLTIQFINESETKTLENLDFAIYEKDSNTVLKSRTGSGSISVTGINQTKEYELKIRLTPKEDGSRYTAQELKNTGGKFVISFTSTAEGGNNA